MLYGGWSIKVYIGKCYLWTGSRLTCQTNVHGWTSSCIFELKFIIWSMKISLFVYFASIHCWYYNLIVLVFLSKRSFHFQMMFSQYHFSWTVLGRCSYYWICLFGDLKLLNWLHTTKKPNNNNNNNNKNKKINLINYKKEKKLCKITWGHAKIRVLFMKQHALVITA